MLARTVNAQVGPPMFFRIPPLDVCARITNDNRLTCENALDKCAKE